jgi:two-component system, chemotaxis family, protein-glutamate methylesterase/glutaminase
LKKIRVIVVDDSALMRKIISDMINAEVDMEAAETARNGVELLEKLLVTQPDVITLDVEMPKLDGIEALKELRRQNVNVPVIMLSSISQRGTQLTIECLEAGAFDFLPKPSGTISLDINKVKDELVQKIRLAYNKTGTRESVVSRREAAADFESSETRAPRKKRALTCHIKPEAVVIGASTGGPKALYAVITALPEKLGVPVFVVQHMPVGFTKAFAERLNSNSDIKVVEASDGELIQKDVVYIAPGGLHMEIGQDKRIHLNTEPTLWGVRPAVDKLFMSAAKVYGSRLVSAVLTGMGRDGAQGTIEVKKAGGITLSEDRSTCTIYGMPKAAYETGMVDEVLPLNEIAIEIMKLVM